MINVKLTTSSDKNLTWENFHALAVAYERRLKGPQAFGYYLVAASLMPSIDGETAARLGTLGYQTGNFTFALECFVLAAARASSPKEKEDRNNAIINIIKTTGLNVTAAELRPRELGLPPLIDRIGKAEGGKSHTCLLLAHAIDMEENVLLSLSEDSNQTSHIFRFSEIIRRVPLFNADLFLLYLCRDLAPDLVLFRHAELTWRNIDPRVETLRSIKEQLKIPIVGLYYDLAKPSYERLCRSYLPSLDAIVTLDAQLEIKRFKNPDVAVMTGWTPLPSSIFFSGPGNRPIDVGFVGRTTAHYQLRSHYFQGLRDAGIKVEVRGADDGTRLSTQEMGEFLRSCKIVLNFSSTAVISGWEFNDDRTPAEITQVDHVKGRVFEAIACGALLLESRNIRTTAYFTPDEHYVEYSDLEELTEKIRYFLANENHRRDISNAGNQHFLKHYTAGRFWQQLEALIDSLRAGS